MQVIPTAGISGTRDPSLNYPMMESTVPTWMLYVLVVGIGPVAVSLISWFNLFPRVNEMMHALLGYMEANIVTILITVSWYSLDFPHCFKGTGCFEEICWSPSAVILRAMQMGWCDSRVHSRRKGYMGFQTIFHFWPCFQLILQHGLCGGLSIVRSHSKTNQVFSKNLEIQHLEFSKDNHLNQCLLLILWRVYLMVRFFLSYFYTSTGILCCRRCCLLCWHSPRLGWQLS